MAGGDEFKRPSTFPSTFFLNDSHLKGYQSKRRTNHVPSISFARLISETAIVKMEQTITNHNKPYFGPVLNHRIIIHPHIHHKKWNFPLSKSLVTPVYKPFRPFGRVPQPQSRDLLTMLLPNIAGWKIHYDGIYQEKIAGFSTQLCYI